MRRFRLSTLMLMIVIAALGIALVVQQRRAARREAELLARLNGAESKVFMLEQRNLLKQWQALSESRSRSKRQPNSDRDDGKAAARRADRVGEGN
jgi:hypothetical protein